MVARREIVEYRLGAGRALVCGSALGALTGLIVEVLFSSRIGVGIGIIAAGIGLSFGCVVAVCGASVYNAILEWAPPSGRVSAVIRLSSCSVIILWVAYGVIGTIISPGFSAADLQILGIGTLMTPVGAAGLVLWTRHQA